MAEPATEAQTVSVAELEAAATWLRVTKRPRPSPRHSCRATSTGSGRRRVNANRTIRPHQPGRAPPGEGDLGSSPNRVRPTVRRAGVCRPTHADSPAQQRSRPRRNQLSPRLINVGVRTATSGPVPAEPQRSLPTGGRVAPSTRIRYQQQTRPHQPCRISACRNDHGRAAPTAATQRHNHSWASLVELPVAGTTPAARLQLPHHQTESARSTLPINLRHRKDPGRVGPTTIATSVPEHSWPALLAARSETASATAGYDCAPALSRRRSHHSRPNLRRPTSLPLQQCHDVNPNRHADNQPHHPMRARPWHRSRRASTGTEIGPSPYPAEGSIPPANDSRTNPPTGAPTERPPMPPRLGD